MESLANPGVQFVVQSVFHAWIVTVAVEVLLIVWEVSRPEVRARFRLLVLTLPLLAWPIFQLAYPARGSDAFRDSLALIDLNAWLELRPLGVPLFYFVAGLLVANAITFFTQELLPALRQQLFSSPPPCKQVPARLERAFARATLACGARTDHTAVCVVAQEEPVAYTAGLRTQRMVISTGLINLLDDEELEAVLAHELAHRKRGDNRTGWLVLGLAAIMFYNPLTLLALRLIAQERERACDDRAAQVTGKPLALASALLKVSRRAGGIEWGYQPAFRTRPVAWLQALAVKARNVQVERRVTRLVHPSLVRPVPWANLRLGLTTAMLATMLFYVV